mmetsp:Transcript_41268/g.127456  ORF Transcript_41268/g.127456 Transcript_41268/m.127456 type:complete len:248 (-) Transcript_41268:1287-2030(-)
MAIVVKCASAFALLGPTRSCHPPAASKRLLKDVAKTSSVATVLSYRCTSPLRNSTARRFPFALKLSARASLSTVMVSASLRRRSPSFVVVNTFHVMIVLSAAVVTSVVPSGWNWSAVMGASCPVNSSTILPVRTLHSVTVLPRDEPAASSSPDGSTEMHDSCVTSDGVKTRNERYRTRSYARHVPSLLHVKKALVLGLTAMPVTPPLCSLKLAKHCPLERFHTLTLPSSPPLTMVAPSRDMAVTLMS